MSDEITAHLDALISANTNLGVSGADPAADVEVDYNQTSDRKLEEIFLDFDLAKIIAIEPALSVTRKGWEITDEGNEPETLRRFSRKDVEAKIKEAVIQSNLYGGAAMIAVGPGPLDEPVRPGEGLVNIAVVSESRMSVQEWEVDLRNSEGFDQPATYTVSENSDEDGGGSSQEIDASRVQRFFGVRLPSRLERRFGGWGQSKIEASWKQIRRLETIEASIETAVHRAASLVLSIAGLEDIDDTPEARQEVKNRVTALIRKISTNRATAISDQESLDWISPTIGPLIESWQIMASAAARSSRTPRTILFGENPAGFNSTDEQGIESWNRRNRELQERQVSPALELLYRVEYGESDSRTISHHSLEEETDLQKVEKRLKMARADAIYLDRGVRDSEQVARSRDSAEGWSMETKVREDLQSEQLGPRSPEFTSQTQKILSELDDLRNRTDAPRGEIPDGPYASPPEELRQYLTQVGVDNPSEAAFRYIKIYNSVFDVTDSLAQARRTAIAMVVDPDDSHNDVFSGPGDSNLPDYVQDLPKDEREQWVEVWNSVFEDTGSEPEAFKRANGVVLDGEGREDASIGATPPKQAQRNAEKVLRWADEHGIELSDRTIRIARMVASGDELKPEEIAAVANQKATGPVTLTPSKRSEPWTDRKWTRWQAHGGTPGVEWAMRQFEKIAQVA